MLATTLRAGNFDFVTGATRWDASIADHTIPDSYFYSSRPAWWDNSPWPPIGPDRAPMVGIIPAENRYQALVLKSRVPPPPTNLRVLGIQ